MLPPQGQSHTDAKYHIFAVFRSYISRIVLAVRGRGGGEVTGDKRIPDFFSTSFLIRKRRVEGVILRVDVVPFRLLICQSVW